MEYQSALHKKLHEGGFAFTAETTPPDASNKEVLLQKAYFDHLNYIFQEVLFVQLG